MKPEGLKVLQIMECTIGGTRRHIRELASGLSMRGHGITVICSAQRDPAFRNDMEHMRRAGVEVHELPMVRAISPFTDLRHLVFLCKFLKARSFDLIHTHSSKAGVLGRLAGYLSGKTPLVHTPHTFAFAFQESSHFLKRCFFMSIERFLGRRTSRLIHVSESERKEAMAFKITREERLTVVENGIDPWPYRWAEPPEKGHGLFPGDDFRPRLGTVGLLNAAKGHDHLVKAFARLKDRFPRAGLAIVGEGELRRSLEGLIADQGLGDRAFISGYREDVPSLLKEMDLFLLPSLWEGMPYVLLEAMASGLPTVVTDVNGSRDIVVNGRTGLVVPPGDARALAEASAEILSDEDKAASMAREGLRRVLTSFTLESMLDKVETVYQEATVRGIGE